MQKLLLLSVFLLLLLQNLFSQNSVEIKYDQAVEAYNQQDYQNALSLINEIKPLYRSVPPKVTYLEILSRYYEIIKSEDSYSFQFLDETRKLTSKYLNVNAKRKNANYVSIQEISNDLASYPKDQASFNSIKEAKQREEALKKEEEERAAADAKAKQEKERLAEIARREKAKLDEKLKQEKAAADLKIKQERDRIRKAEAERQAEIDNQAYLVAQAERERLAKEYAEIEKIRIRKEEKKERRRLKSFSSIGFQSGEIAKYGFLYERGGGKAIGFNFSARSTLISEADILSGAETVNKNEATLGINVKVAKWLYLNLAAGYGYYDFVNRNDYLGDVFLEKVGYTVSSAGLMIRINRVININGGVSFMDIEKDFYNPEITFGLSFNMKKRNKQ